MDCGSRASGGIHEKRAVYFLYKMPLRRILGFVDRVPLYNLANKSN